MTRCECTTKLFTALAGHWKTRVCRRVLVCLVGVQTEKQHRADSHNIAPKMAEEPREKRERKATVEVYSIASPTKKEFVIPEGAGTKVGDIPNGA
mgnify:CR=1 FL=1